MIATTPPDVPRHDPLLPCPFCGSNQVHVTAPGPAWMSVDCFGCGVTLRRMTDQVEHIVARWNTRQPLAATGEVGCSPAMKAKIEQAERVAAGIVRRRIATEADYRTRRGHFWGLI